MKVKETSDGVFEFKGNILDIKFGHETKTNEEVLNSMDTISVVHYLNGERGNSELTTRINNYCYSRDDLRRTIICGLFENLQYYRDFDNMSFSGACDFARSFGFEDCDSLEEVVKDIIRITEAFETKKISKELVSKMCELSSDGDPELLAKHIVFVREGE